MLFLCMGGLRRPHIRRRGAHQARPLALYHSVPDAAHLTCHRASGEAADDEPAALAPARSRRMDSVVAPPLHVHDGDVRSVVVPGIALCRVSPLALCVRASSAKMALPWLLFALTCGFPMRLLYIMRLVLA